MTQSGDLVSLLPHRPPLRLLDSATMGSDRVLQSRQRIPRKDPMLEGHFPTFPIWPGSLLAEAMAQTTAVWLLHEMGALKEAEIPLLGAADCRFLRPVFPGDVIHYETRLVRKMGHRGLFTVHAIRGGGEVVARGRFGAAIVPRPAPPAAE